MTLIEANNISHSYGKQCILRNISLHIEKGRVIGLLGPSGAGKTTLVNILTGQLKPTAGHIKLHEENLKSGIMMDSFGLYERLTVWDNLKIFAELYGVKPDKIKPLLGNAELTDAGKTVVKKLSKGMRNRVNFCRALLKDTDILYLDEPTAGLDPATTNKIHELILAEKKKGTTIFLTTHNMHEAEQLCDSIVLLNAGTIIEQGTPTEICMKYNIENRIEVTLSNGEKRLYTNRAENAAAIAGFIEQEQVVSIHSSEPNLETVFLHLTGKELNE